MASTTAGLTYADLARPLIRLFLLGYQPTHYVVGETLANLILNMEEFRKKAQGVEPARSVFGAPLPVDLDVFVHSGVGADKVGIVCAGSAAVQATAIPLEIESEKIISKQIEDTVVSITSDFINSERDSRVLVDQTVTFNATDGQAGGFPTRMTAE